MFEYIYYACVYGWGLNRLTELCVHLLNHTYTIAACMSFNQNQLGSQIKKCWYGLYVGMKRLRKCIAKQTEQNNRMGKLYRKKWTFVFFNEFIISKINKTYNCKELHKHIKLFTFLWNNGHSTAVHVLLWFYTLIELK